MADTILPEVHINHLHKRLTAVEKAAHAVRQHARKHATISPTPGAGGPATTPAPSKK